MLQLMWQWFSLCLSLSGAGCPHGASSQLLGERQQVDGWQPDCRGIQALLNPFTSSEQKS